MSRPVLYNGNLNIRQQFVVVVVVVVDPHIQHIALTL